MAFLSRVPTGQTFTTDGFWWAGGVFAGDGGSK